MQLDILTPEHKVYSGKVYGVQLPGIEGYFEILDKHAPLIATLGKGKITTELYEISGGFVEVLNNKASVLIESATALD